MFQSPCLNHECVRTIVANARCIWNPATLVVGSSQDWGADTIPIGDLDFVRAALCHALNRDANMTPIEIPDPLLPFCGRKYVRLKGKDIIGTQYADPEKYFIKDITELKHWNSLMQMTDVSDQIDPRRKHSVSGELLGHSMTE